jgi:2-amino-4-hydroxy-6-hydroxymethyldihydropteridine diphosphokinase
MRAGVALGANIGDRLVGLIAAREQISRLAGVSQPILSSPIYETEAVGCEPGAPGFLNAVIEIGYSGAPLLLFDELRRIEAGLGRPAEHARNVSRSIDIDLLYVDDLVLTTNRLTVPHPRMSERRFVLQPLADIQPHRLLPGQRKTICELLASAPQSARVERSTTQWGL